MRAKEGEKFRSPMEIVEGIDASRDRAREEALAAAAKLPPAPPSPIEDAPKTSGVVALVETEEAPRYTTANILAAIRELDEAGEEIAKEIGKTYRKVPTFAKFAAPVWASCANDLPAAEEVLPWPVRWGGGILAALAIGLPWASQFVPDPPKLEKTPGKTEQGGAEAR